MDLMYWGIGIAAVVGIIFPAYAIAYGSRTRHLVLADTSKRIYVYRGSIVQLVLLMALTLIPAFIAPDYLDAIGLEFIFHPGWAISLIVLPLVALWMFNRINLTPKAAEKFVKQHAASRYLFPAQLKEYHTWVGVSYAAGICEEIMYRGFLLWFLTTLMPLAPAILLANLPFALAHLTTTGLRNSIGAFVLALIFTGAFYLSGGLWLPILLHILVDLYVGTLAHKSLQLLEETES